MKPKRLYFCSVLVAGGLTLASQCVADDQSAQAPPPPPAQAPPPAPAEAPAPPPAEAPAPPPAQAPAPTPAPRKSLFGSLFQINIGQPPPPSPAPVVVAPAPAPVVVAPAMVPETYVWDGYEYVGFVGGQYLYLGPGNVWMPLEAYRLNRWYYYQRYHPDWRAHMIHREIHDEHLQQHYEQVQEKDAAHLQEQKQKDAEHLQNEQAKQQKKKHGGE